MIEDPPLLTIRRNFPRPSDELIAGFSGVPTGNVVDAMGGLGCLDCRIKPLVQSSQVMVGTAVTCYAGPSDGLAVFGALHAARRGDIVVAATDAFTHTAIAGDLLLGMARNRGVAGFVTDGSVRDLDVWAAPQPELFLPLMQEPTASFRLVARTAGDPASALAEIRSALWAAEPDLAITSSRTMREVIARSLTPQRIAAVLLVVLSLCALGLAVCGLYGVVSMAAHQRIPEIGIRMALGAARGDLLRLLLRQGFRLTAIGVAIGVGAGIAIGRLLSSALYGIGAGDLLGTILLGLLFLAVAMAVSYLPLRKPTRLEPLNALRR